MAILLQVAQLGNKILRSKAKPVKDVSDPKTQQLIDDMLATLIESEGLGIAAPQIYQSLQIFYVASHPNSRYPDAPTMKPLAIINPVILKSSEEIYKDWEGCLSIPGLRGFVPRPREVSVEFTDRKGNRRRKTFKDLIGRIFQHEFDHIQGILFVDRVESGMDYMTDKEFQKYIKKK
jgi:peptide deformylase